MTKKYDFSGGDAIADVIILLAAAFAKTKCGKDPEQAADETFGAYVKELSLRKPLPRKITRREQDIRDILSYLDSGKKENGKYTTFEVVRGANVDYGRMTQILNSYLDPLGYTKKTKMPNNKKRVLIEITPKGKSELERMVKKNSLKISNTLLSLQ